MQAIKLASEWLQNTNKGVTVATSHGLPPPYTCHTDLSVETKRKRTYRKTGP